MPNDLKITWARQTGPYQLGEDCFLGKIRVGSVHWGNNKKGETRPWQVSHTLPGFRQFTERRWNTPEEGKTFLEAIISRWVDSTQADRS